MNYEWNNRIATEVGVRMLYTIFLHHQHKYNNRCHTIALRIIIDAFFFGKRKCCVSQKTWQA